jgi:uncharacterized OB-fold protein
MEGTKLNGSGKVLSYTIIHDGPEEFKNQVPYTLALIELDEGARITAQVVDKTTDEGEDQDKKTTRIDIGSKVNCVFRKISEDGKSGTIHYGYKFKLAQD